MVSPAAGGMVPLVDGWHGFSCWWVAWLQLLVGGMAPSDDPYVTTVFSNDVGVSRRNQSTQPWSLLSVAATVPLSVDAMVPPASGCHDSFSS